MKWEKKVPDHAGYWLRINAIGKPQIHYIFEIDEILVIEWGWGGEKENMRINGKIAISKLKYFYWLPLEDIPKLK